MSRSSDDLEIVEVTEFLRRAQARAARVRRHLRHLSGREVVSTETIHDLHRDLRRVRFDLRLVRRTLSKAERGALDRQDAALKTITKSVGRVRDSDVLESLVRHMGEDGRGEDAQAFRALADRLHREGVSLRRDLSRASAELLKAGTLDLRPHWKAVRNISPSKRRFERAADKELEGTRRGLNAALKWAQSRPSLSHLHHLRISLRKLRQLRYALASDLSGQALEPTWGRLQTRLGAHHDLGVLDEWLRSLPRPGAPKTVRKRVRMHLERSQQRVQRAVAKHGARA